MAFIDINDVEEFGRHGPVVDDGQRLFGKRRAFIEAGVLLCFRVEVRFPSQY